MLYLNSENCVTLYLTVQTVEPSKHYKSCTQHTDI